MPTPGDPSAALGMTTYRVARMKRSVIRDFSFPFNPRITLRFIRATVFSVISHEVGGAFAMTISE